MQSISRCLKVSQESILWSVIASQCSVPSRRQTLYTEGIVAVDPSSLHRLLDPCRRLGRFTLLTLSIIQHHSKNNATFLGTIPVNFAFYDDDALSYTLLRVGGVYNQIPNDYSSTEFIIHRTMRNKSNESIHHF